VPFSEQDILYYLISQQFNECISHTRAVPSIDPHKRILTGDENELLMNVLNSATCSIPIPSDQRYFTAASTLLRDGFVAANNSKLIFASPMVKSIFTTRLLSKPMVFMSNTAITFFGFLETTISRLRRRFLVNSLGVGVDNKLLERQWQNEFYSVATTVLPGMYYISPDVGHIFGTEGLVDYYVDSNLQLVIELLREGEDMAEHEKKFKTTGIYAKMGSKIKNWIILDFRSEKKKVMHLKDGFWHILYPDDFSYVTIHCKYFPDKIIRLLKE